MNSYDSLLMDQLPIRNVSQFSPKSDAHYPVESDRVRSGDRPREWVQIQRWISCGQSADTVV
jgi:hypothetical protein